MKLYFALIQVIQTRSCVNYSRICPGRFFAERTLWLTIASTLAVFDIKPVVDPTTGKEIMPVADYVETLTR